MAFAICVGYMYFCVRIYRIYHRYVYTHTHYLLCICDARRLGLRFETSLLSTKISRYYGRLSPYPSYEFAINFGSNLQRTAGWHIGSSSLGGNQIQKSHGVWMVELKKKRDFFRLMIHLSVPRNNEWMVVFHIWISCPIQKSATLIYQPENLTARVIKQDKNYSEYCWVVNGGDDVFFLCCWSWVFGGKPIHVKIRRTS